MRSLIGALALLAWLQNVPELRDNPEYQAWAAFAPGSWVEYRDAIVGEPHPPDHRTTTKLVQITPEKIVLEVLVKLRTNEKTSEFTQKVEIPAKDKVTHASAEKGEDEVEVDGKKLKCAWEKWTIESQGKKGTKKIWLHPDVPGRLVKEEVQMEGQFDSLRRAIRWEKK